MLSSYPLRYIPIKLTRKDKRKQVNMIEKSKKNYRKGKYYVREKISSFKNQPSKHVIKAHKIYKIGSIKPSKELSKATGCSMDALKKIVSKGEGAYFSSGSRPSQTPQSWGVARLASSITGGKSAAVDFKILREGCNHNKLAYKYALKSKRKYREGHSKTKHITI
jgi:hypothetical protein